MYIKLDVYAHDDFVSTVCWRIFNIYILRFSGKTERKKSQKNIIDNLYDTIFLLEQLLEAYFYYYYLHELQKIGRKDFFFFVILLYCSKEYLNM